MGTAQPESVTPASIAGRASVIDGDTIEIHGEIDGTRIRLHGIDAPESDQTCVADGTITRCGRQAAAALAGEIGGEPVICEPKDRDPYGRVVAVCHSGNRDLNAWMVAEGWAMAYRQFATDYVAEEEAAIAARRGIWQGEFEPPWAWRRKARVAAAEPRKAPGCAIKGNISSGGERIYHVPGGRFYENTKIDTANGERWFCNEAEARAAGWRRSKV